MRLDDLLRQVAELQATDLYLIPGSVPCMNHDGDFVAPRGAEGLRLPPETVENFARAMMTDAQWADFEREREANLAFHAPRIGRFRVNVYRQRGAVAMVMRRVVMDIPTLRDLALPPVLRDVALAPRGIVLVTGPTGSGKSTTMASMIDYRNHALNGHIITIEDPIEFVYQHRRSIVTQREVGIDTRSFGEALRNSLRQAPQVISIGELRDADIVQFALHASETGHLVFATLHSTNATLAVERVLHFYPAAQKEQVLLQLSLNLRAVVCQRLVPRVGGGRACAAEVMVNTPRVQDLILRGDLSALRMALAAENLEGIQNFDKALYILHKRGLIGREDALRAADSPNDLAMKLRGIGIEPGSSWERTDDPWRDIPDPYAIPSGHPAAARAAEARYENEPEAEDEEVYGAHSGDQFRAIPFPEVASYEDLRALPDASDVRMPAARGRRAPAPGAPAPGGAAPGGAAPVPHFPHFAGDASETNPGFEDAPYAAGAPGGDEPPVPEFSRRRSGRPQDVADRYKSMIERAIEFTEPEPGAEDDLDV